mmetsp:Transcript_21049/g.45685  ORF Transcript_21049/g.45685 Transcript_21049/m.45685 type:complete len:89 (-) Transcript_21049:1935-2201(-)
MAMVAAVGRPSVEDHYNCTYLPSSEDATNTKVQVIELTLQHHHDKTTTTQHLSRLRHLACCRHDRIPAQSQEPYHHLAGCAFLSSPSL